MWFGIKRVTQGRIQLNDFILCTGCLFLSYKLPQNVVAWKFKNGSPGQFIADPYRISWGGWDVMIYLQDGCFIHMLGIGQGWLAVSWKLNWDHHLKCLYMVSLCGLGFSYHDFWIPRESIPREYSKRQKKLAEF